MPIVDRRTHARPSTVYLYDDQVEALFELRERLKVPTSTIHRLAIDWLLNQLESGIPWTALIAENERKP